MVRTWHNEIMQSTSRNSTRDTQGRNASELPAIISRIDWTTLRLFIAAVEEASIGKAAEREHMAQSAVSKRLAELEQVLRVQLLERHRRGVVPTPAGAALIEHARKILNDLHQMERDIASYSTASNTIRGHVRVRASESALFGVFPDTLSRFLGEYPDISVDLQPDTSAGAVRAVRENVADIGLFWSDQPIEGLSTFPCYLDTLVVALPRSHPIAGARSLKFETLLDYEIIQQEPLSAIQMLIEQMAAQAGRGIKGRVRVSGFDAICRMVAAGFGIGIVPDLFVTERASRLGLIEIPLDEPWASRLHKVCIRRGGDLPMATRLLAEYLSNERTRFIRTDEP
jgi:DNA-binding transcriptional LysR family regulator